MNIKIHNEHKDDIFNVLVDNLRQFNFDKMGEERSQPLIVSIHDDNDEVVGGIAGRTIYHQSDIQRIIRNLRHRIYKSFTTDLGRHRTVSYDKIHRRNGRITITYGI